VQTFSFVGATLMTEYSVKVFDPSKVEDDQFWDNFYKFYAEFIKELHPNDPLTPKERLVKTLKDPHPHYHIHHWLVFTPDNSIIGWADNYISKKDHPAYDTNKHIAGCDTIILKEHRGKGLGTKLWKYHIETAKKFNRTLIQAGTSEESGHNFLKKFGGTEAIKGSENRLQMKEVDWLLMQEWIDEGPRRANDVILEQFTDVPESDIDEYCEIYTETMNQQPFGELEGRVKETPDSRRLSEERLRKRGGKWTTLISKEKNGTISGLTEVFYYPDKPTMLYQNLTGVKEEYRGRGLGKWLKASMIKWISEEYPEVTTIITGNATTNVPMLSINKRMGFKENKSGSEYKFQVAELETKLN
jgi:GNAT superfamily N-acetyltransferase